MKIYVKLFLAGAVLMGLSAASSAQANNRDVVRDARGNMVCSQHNNCVRSKWLNPYDECGQGSVRHAQSRADAVYFDFGSAVLTARSKATLNALADQIVDLGRDVDTVRVIGFADQIGSAAANEKLSKRRADAVRRYLISKGVVSRQVLETRWFGDSIRTTICPVNLPKAKRIKCLQPDRRVEIEIEQE